MIDLLDIAKEYQNILGDNFTVKLDNDIDPRGTKTQCVLTLGRRPFMVTGIDSESFDVVMNFYPSINSEMQNINALYEMSILTAPLSGDIVSNGKTYNYNSFLSFRQPANPQVDTGEFKQVKTITGSLFVTSDTDGAILSNFIDYEFYDQEPTEENEDTITGGQLIVSQMTADFMAMEKSPRKMNKSISATYLSNKTHMVSIQFYTRPDAICEKLIKFLKGDNTNENAIWYLKETWNAFENLSFTNKVKIKAGSKIIAIGGGFVEILLNLHIMP
jgi:hypothetical protein